MNSTGFLRGYMAKNMNAESFINVVAKALSREFEHDVKVNSLIDNEFEIYFKDLKISINVDLINDLKSKSPYAVDKLLLQELGKQGFSFNERRSQYMYI